MPALAAGALEETQVTFDEAARWLVVERGGLAWVACNFAAKPQPVPLLAAAQGAALTLASADGARLEAGIVWLPGLSVAILTLSLE